jgi:transglutaminase-like putative cysteine protease
MTYFLLNCQNKTRTSWLLKLRFHKTTYTFDRSVKLFPHVFRLRPAAHSRTAIEGYTFKISPENHFINWQQDPFGNYQARIVFPDKIKELTVEVEVIAKLQVINPFDYFVEEYAEEFPFTYDQMLQQELTAYLNLSEESPIFLKFMEGLKLNNQYPLMIF